MAKWKYSATHSLPRYKMEMSARSASRPGSFTPGERTPCPLDRGPKPVWTLRKKKHLSLLGINSVFLIVRFLVYSLYWLSYPGSYYCKLLLEEAMTTCKMRSECGDRKRTTPVFLSWSLRVQTPALRFTILRYLQLSSALQANAGMPNPKLGSHQFLLKFSKTLLGTYGNIRWYIWATARVVK